MDNLTAAAIHQAEKSGLPHNPNIIVETISEAEADSRPAAICEAFCQAVEASGE